MKPAHDTLVASVRRAETRAPREEPDAFDLEHRPEAVLSVLEADQLVAAKERAQFGRRQLPRGIRVLLGGLRLYVIVMMVLVAIQVLHAVRGGH